MRFHVGLSFRLKHLKKFLIPIALGLFAYFGFSGIFDKFLPLCFIPVYAETNTNTNYQFNLADIDSLLESQVFSDNVSLKTALDSVVSSLENYSNYYMATLEFSSGINFDFYTSNDFTGVPTYSLYGNYFYDDSMCEFEPDDPDCVMQELNITSQTNFVSTNGIYKRYNLMFRDISSMSSTSFISNVLSNSQNLSGNTFMYFLPYFGYANLYDYNNLNSIDITLTNSNGYSASVLLAKNFDIKYVFPSNCSNQDIYCKNLSVKGNVISNNSFILPYNQYQEISNGNPLIDSTGNILLNFISWFSGFSLSLIANPFIIILLGISIVYLIYKIIINLRK